MPGFNIEEFKADINKKAGLQRNNRFLMTFPTPAPLLKLSTQTGMQSNLEINRSIELWCESINFPGYQIMTHDVRRYTFGPVEKRPFAPNFGQLQCTFLSDGDGNIWNFFNDWLQVILPHDADRGINAKSRRYTDADMYEVSYKETYITELNIYTYHENGDPIQNIVCREAFPTQIADIPLSWADTNNLVRLQVTFEFLDWFSRPISNGDNPGPSIPLP